MNYGSNKCLLVWKKETNLVAETGAVNLPEPREHRGLPPLRLTQQAKNASCVFISLPAVSVIPCSFICVYLCVWVHVYVYCMCMCGHTCLETIQGH